jgi:ChaB
MPGVELSTSACDGHVVVALRGDLDVTGAADAEAAIAALAAPGRCLIIDMSALDFIDCGRCERHQPHRWHPWTQGGVMLRSRRYSPAGNELPATLRRSCQEAQDTFTRARDSAAQVYGDRDHADRAAFTALKEKFEKRDDHWIAKRDPGD